MSLEIADVIECPRVVDLDGVAMKGGEILTTVAEADLNQID